ncbi:restriction endonuclease subunit S [Bradyrhizobium sp. AZCC 1577]|uniref:restriction endonuclease subunit S n=1 Tax=Bradyrhizobium sp. AZCC 1577 TaxID=3117019 RepID=UPI002FF12B4B
MDYSKYQLVEPNDFVMNHMDLLTGYVDVSKVHGVTSPDYRVFTARKKGLSLRFFLYLFQNGYQRRIFYAFGQGASGLGRWRMPTDSFNDFILPVPPLAEQLAIAGLLDRETAKIDALVQEQQRLMELLKQKRQAVISHAVTKGLSPKTPMKDSGVEWLGQVPKHWSTAKLRSLTRQIVDGAHFTPTYVGDGVPFLRVTDITRPTIELEEVKRIPLAEHNELSKRCRPEKGDLLLSKNGTIGVPKVIDWEWEFSIFVSLCLIKFSDEMNAEYAAFVFRSRAIETQIEDGSKQSTVTNLHLEKIASFRFPVPPLDEQSLIVTRLNEAVSQLDGLMSTASRAVELLQERRAALISAAVTGKIDVRGLVEDVPAHDMAAA